MRKIEEVIAEAISDLPQSRDESNNINIEKMLAKWRILKVLLMELGILDQVFVEEAPGTRCLEEEDIQA